MSIPSDNPILLARDLGPGESDPAVSLAVGDGEIVALTRCLPADSPLLRVAGPGAPANPAHPVGYAPPEQRPAGGGVDSAPLLRRLAGMDPGAGGELWLKGVAVHLLRPAARLRFSHTQCAVLPRTSRLLPELSLAENTALPLLLAGVRRGTARRTALDWLARLQVEEFAGQRPGSVSGSVLRRASIARALVTGPSVLLADEPLAGLDPADRFNLLRILRAAAGSHNLTLLISTVDPELALWADRSVGVPVLEVPKAETAEAADPAETAEMAEAVGAA